MWKSLMLGLTLVIASTTAAAANQCNTRDNVLKLLANKYSEAPVALGVTNNGGLVEVLKSDALATADTWTIIITTPKGMSCLVAAGEGWRAVDRVPVEPET